MKTAARQACGLGVFGALRLCDMMDLVRQTTRLLGKAGCAHVTEPSKKAG